MFNGKVFLTDLDGVLGGFRPMFCNIFLPNQFGLSIPEEDYHENWALLPWIRDERDAAELRKAFYKDAGKWYMEMPVIQGAEWALRETGKMGFRNEIATSRIEAVRGATTEWIEKYFKGLISEIHMLGLANMVGRDDPERTKGGVCRNRRAYYFTDDSADYCIEAARAGTFAFLFGDYKWNRKIQLCEGDAIVRAENWPELIDFIKHMRGAQ